MAKVEVMSLDERLDISIKATALEEAGEFEEADRLMKTIPMPYYLAKVIKEKEGLDALLNSGWNLSEAEEKFGADWLTC